MIELFRKIINRFQPLTIFTEKLHFRFLAGELNAETQLLNIISDIS